MPNLHQNDLLRYCFQRCWSLPLFEMFRVKTSEVEGENLHSNFLQHYFSKCFKKSLQPKMFIFLFFFHILFYCCRNLGYKSWESVLTNKKLTKRTLIHNTQSTPWKCCQLHATNSNKITWKTRLNTQKADSFDFIPKWPPIKIGASRGENRLERELIFSKISFCFVTPSSISFTRTTKNG